MILSELEGLIPVPMPEKVIPNNGKYPTGVNYGWSDEENQLIESIYPRLEVTAEDLREYLPWRSVNAIRLQASRLRIKKESLLEHILRRAAC